MATRSVIGMEKDGKILAVYCNWDGYLENNGVILEKHYQNPEKILHLIALGDMSSLGAEVFPPEGVTHSFTKAADNVTVFYGRDRGESDAEFKVFDTREEMVKWYDGSEYFYLWTDDQWVYSRGRSWMNLAHAIAEFHAGEDS